MLYVSAELNRLWNVCPDNMAACRSKDRDFLPTLENYFEEAIEQLDPSVEPQYKYVSFFHLRNKTRKHFTDSARKNI